MSEQPDNQSDLKALYLEPDEEITSVVDRLKEIEAAEVAIIVPRRAGILQSIINLKLLRYQAERQKKRISIVTTDRTGRNLASAVGLTVYQKLPEGIEVKESAVHEPEAAAPIKFKRKQTVTPEDEQTPVPPPAAPEITRTPVPDAVPEGDLETVPDETKEDTTSTPDQTDGTAAPFVKPAADPTDASETDTAKQSTERPTKQRFSVPKLPTVKAPKLKAPRKPSLKRAGRTLGKKGAVVGVIVLLVLLAGGAAAATFAFPSATVRLTAKSDPLAVDAPVTFSARATAPNAAGNVMPAKVIEVTVDASVQSQATGSQSGGEPAKGAVVLVNQQGRNQSLVARTRLAAPDGKIYRIQERAVVPAGGELPVTVVADEGGEAGNLPAGTRLSVPGLGGNTQIFGRVDTALTGGTSGDGAKVVSSGDLERAKAELGQRAAQDGLGQARAKLAVGYQLNPQVAATTVLSSSASPAQGAAAESFTLTGPVKVAYFTYQEELLSQLLDDDTKAKVPAGSELVGDGSNRSFTVNQVSGDQLTTTARINAFVTPVVSREQLKQQVAGKNPQAAEATLRQSGQASRLEVRFFPPWLGTLPSDPDRITLEFVAGGGASPGPSAAPSQAATPTSGPSAPPNI